ncbi:protein PHLOEM PROTEIN 2-LIKE A9 [Durio zibethinus]|uniref:Protein PHLOEM PROTEIN 2-LIKE A9 n=1 Tax=Durio zibethinus TaxID=66656 RepID=A0A6P6BJN0_DURZI|nr:protein PHLOEM PROTEIN 2-LIKE A9 [Durio zibethinus]
MASKPHHDADKDAISEIQDGIVLKPRGFNIVWGNDSRYWRVPPQSSRPIDSDEFAELVQVSWLELTGSVQLKPSTTYQITFKLSFKEDAFGWNGSPVFLMAKVGKKGKYKWKRLNELEMQLPKEPTDIPANDDPFVVDVPGNQPDTMLFFGLYEVWGGKWKGGLRVHGAIVKQLVK